MKTVGIWIDRRKAVLVTIDEGNESSEVVESELERHPGPEGSRRTSTSWGPQVKSADRQVEDRNRLVVNRFYKVIIRKIGVPDRMLVMGPAEAKQEFATLVQSTSALRRVAIKVEPADRMSETQVAERTRRTEF
jgi:hypothetical protein